MDNPSSPQLRGSILEARQFGLQQKTEEHRADCFPWQRLLGALGRAHGADPSEDGIDGSNAWNGLRKSAVIALMQVTAQYPRDPQLLLIERSKKLRSHAGQLAFPGGKHELHDENLLATALREAEEEVGLNPDNVAILGRLSPVVTPTNFVIVPFVARILGPWLPDKCSTEVANILQPRLSILRARYRAGSPILFRGRMHPMHEYKIHDPPLWGATARMVYELIAHLDEAKSP